MTLKVILGISYRWLMAVTKWLDVATMTCWSVNRGQGLSPVVSCEGQFVASFILSWHTCQKFWISLWCWFIYHASCALDTLILYLKVAVSICLRSPLKRRDVQWQNFNNNNNNNNNTLIYIVPACRMTSEALAEVQVVLLNVWRKSSVLSLRLNPLIELQCNVSESNEFQTEGAQHQKARSAKCVLVVGLWSSGMVDERSWRVVSRGLMWSLR